MNRLWVRLTLAFAVVVLVTVAAIALLANLTVDREFRRYLSWGEEPRDPAPAGALAAYYEEHRSWQGVAEMGLLPATPAPESGWPWPMRPWMMLRGEGRAQIVLADIEGRVIYDGAGYGPGRVLTEQERAIARPVIVDDEVVGQLVVVMPMHMVRVGPLEQDFLAGLQRWLVIGAGWAVGLGLLLSLLLSRSLTAPLRRLAVAARAVASGDLGHRVAVGGSAEVDEVSQAFNEMSEALQRAERQRQAMVADVAHELRTPLSVLQGNLQAILDQVYPLDRAEVSRLYDQTLLLGRLVEDLRQLALADAGRLSLNLQATDLSRLLRTTTENMAQATKDGGVTLTVEASDDLPAVQADPDRLAQVLTNLLANALQHTPSGGAVTVTASLADGFVQIAVADTGEGIAPQDLPRIFDRFWRADPSRARDDRWRGGAGLGLSIARSLIEAHGGRIWAESAPGRGSTIRFTIPASS